MGEAGNYADLLNPSFWSHQGDRVCPVPVEIRDMDQKTNQEPFEDLPPGMIEELQETYEYLYDGDGDPDDPDPWVDRVIW